MEIVIGKRTRPLDALELSRFAARYPEVLMDVGTGDGKFVLHEARRNPDALVIGLDACRDGMRTASRKAPSNALFIAGNALGIPAELSGLATRITINFPWGSLLSALLVPESDLPGSLRRLARPGCVVEVRLNLSALTMQGWEDASAALQVRRALEAGGFGGVTTSPLDPGELRGFPSTWSKKLGHGRSPHAVLIRGTARSPYILLPAQHVVVVGPDVEIEELDAVPSQYRRHVGAMLGRVVDRLKHRHERGHLVGLAPPGASYGPAPARLRGQPHEFLAAPARPLDQTLDPGSSRWSAYRTISPLSDGISVAQDLLLSNVSRTARHVGALR